MSASKKRKVDDPLAALVRRAVALRRELHAYPEPGFEEKETQRRIRAVLAELDKPPTDKNAVRCVALRSDMDALRMTEKNECLAHRSRHEGVAHMCGHDGHMASLVLAAALVARRKDRLPAGASVRLLFQPAEEGPGGALPMIMDGALEGVDECYGFHNWPSFPLGEVHPHAGVDAVLAGSAVVQALHTITSRSTRSDENAVVSVTQFHAGEATNVLPDSAVLKGTIRDLDPAVFDLIEKRITEVSAGVAAGYGATAEVKIDSMYPVVFNHAASYDHVVAAAGDLGLPVSAAGLPMLGAEDFAYLIDEKMGGVPGCFFFFVGGKEDAVTKLAALDVNLPEVCAKVPAAKAAKVGAASALRSNCMCHATAYDFNDNIIPVAAKMYVKILERRLLGCALYTDDELAGLQ
ncbi:IAA-amino acid conjugate hydrolase [Aureococcus anophagefferens]|nr:IAA-amino acid conjugate hydrolase [Aureococcus anophagefferens]